MNFTDAASSLYHARLSSSLNEERAFRERAWEGFVGLNLPSKRDEAWRYTSLALEEWTPWLQGSVDQALIHKELSSEILAYLRFWSQQFDLVVLIDGLLSQEHTSLHRRYLKPVDFATLNHGYTDGWSALNCALGQPGFRIEIPAGAVLDRPVLLVHVQLSDQRWNPSVNQIVLDRDSQLNLAELFVGSEGNRYLRTNINSVRLAQSSVLNWIRVQREVKSAFCYSEIHGQIAASSRFGFVQFNGGATWSRSCVNLDLLGEQAEACLSGLTFAAGEQFSEQQVRVRHEKGMNSSSQLFKSVLKDRARGVMNGKIYIAQGAQKVSSSQLNHNLLLSRTAEADTKPELEIYADDVKANHGASVGRLDENKLFYLMSRGISRSESMQLLARAFAEDILMRIESRPLRNFAESSVNEWLADFSYEMEKVV